MIKTHGINLTGRGLRGESQADILRRTGRYGVLPTDSDNEVMGKLNAAAEAAAATAEAASGPNYPDTASGLAATEDGEGFAVDNGDGTVTVWLNDGGTAVEQRTLATTDYLASPNGAAGVGLPDGGTVADLTAAEAGKGAALVGRIREVAGAIGRTLDEVLNDRAVTPEDWGAIGDGTLHPVSEWIIPGVRGRYASLADLQADFPHVTSDEDGIDWAAIQAAVTYAMENEADVNCVSEKTYYIDREIDFPKHHSGVIRKYVTFHGRDCTFFIAPLVTAIGYTKTGAGAFDNANYFINFRSINFRSEKLSGAIAIRPAGFVSCNYHDLHFQDVDYPFWSENDDPRQTPNYVQSAHITGCYSIGHRRFFNANQVYDFRANWNIIDAGYEGIWIIRTNTLGQSGYVCDISENIFQSHSGRAVVVGGSQALSVQRNYFENNAFEILLVGTTVQTDGPNGSGVYWEYLGGGVTAWAAGEHITTSGTYRTNAGNLYVSSGIGKAGTTPPTHTGGTVSDGGVLWTFVGAVSAWTNGEAIGTVGLLRSTSGRMYRAATTGTCGIVTPAHTFGTIHNYGGAIRDNFNQPKGTAVAGYRAFIELPENADTGMNLGGNVDQSQRAFSFSRWAKGYWNTLGDRTAMPLDRLYNPNTRPDDTRALFQIGHRLGVLWGSDGGMVFNPISRGLEYTHAEYDYADSVTSARVPVVHGYARVVPTSYGAPDAGKAFPPSSYAALYPQKPWARGSYLANPKPEVLGTAGSQYVVQGWVCTAAGTPGTWVECRALTGS